MKEKEITISEFFNKNQAVINGVALFIALAQLSLSYATDQRIAHAFSGLFLGMVVLLSTELIRNFPKKPTYLMYFFQSFFILVIGLFTLYWFLINLDLLIYSLIGIVVGLFMGVIFIIYKRIRFDKKWKDHI